MGPGRTRCKYIPVSSAAASMPRTVPPGPTRRLSTVSCVRGRCRVESTLGSGRQERSCVRSRLLSPPCSEPSTAGESGAKRRGCPSEASSAPSPDSPRSAGHRCAAPARGWRSVSLVTFFSRKESDKPNHRGRATAPAKRPAPPNPLFAASLQVAKIQFPQCRVLPRRDPGHAQHREPTQHHGRHQAEQLRHRAGIERAQLVGRTDEDAVD